MSYVRPISIAFALLTGLPGGMTASAQEPIESPDPVASEPREVANRFERARRLPAPDRLAAIEAMRPGIEEILDGDRNREHRAALRFLAGELASELGDHRTALERYRKAAKDLGKTPFREDAEFAAIQALEALGRDPEAEEDWLEWIRRNPKSPLLPEARIALTWNHLRQGKQIEAARSLSQIETQYAWLRNDPRVIRGKALERYLAGDFETALEELSDAPASSGVLYLKALCHRELGSLLRSAAFFQEVGDRYPHSSLRDYAYFAKANTFLAAEDYRSAGEEFDRVVETMSDPDLRAEAELRGAACLYLGNEGDHALARLREVVERHPGTKYAARAQFLIGDLLYSRGDHEAAIVELNHVLTSYFEHSVAASAQYRVARSLDAMGRKADATSAYQTVVSGYPLEPEAPAAAYLAGVGLLESGKPLAAVPYFQLVLDRYASRNDSLGHVVFARTEHREVVEAALCLLEYSFHQAGDLGRLSGAPHLLLHQMPPSRSPWRAYALLIDADASASQGRHDEAQSTLKMLMREFPDHPVGAPATKLLAWTYARQGNDSLAIETEERLLARYAGSDNEEILSAAMLDIAHVRFNQKRYRDAGQAYDDFVSRYGVHPRVPIALYHAGICYLRLDRAGDAVDRWERLVRESPQAPIAQKAWSRAGDLYFQAEEYDDAKRCYQGLLENFPSTSSHGMATLRMAQCDYNAGRDAEALERFSAIIDRYPGTVWANEASRGQESALYRLGRSPEGTEVLGQLVEQHPTSAFAAEAQFQIAWAAYEAKRYPEAAEAFRRVVSQFPGYSAADRAHFLMADSYQNMGSDSEATLAYQQFLSYFPRSELRSTVQFRLGLARFEAEEYLPAALAFTQVLDDTASTEIASAARYNLALCQRQLGRPMKARAELEEYRRLHPGDERAVHVAYQLGDLHLAAGEAKAATKEFERALSLGPEAPLAMEIQFRLGGCHEQLGSPDAALRAYEVAAGGTPKDDPFRLSAVARTAALYETKGDVRAALVAYRDIVKHANDAELVALASSRVSELETIRKAR